jgi:formylglycine-generating enzyme required for sulfatase activity
MLTLLVVVAAARAAAPAADPPKLKTQTVPVKVVRDTPWVGGEHGRAIELVQLPAGTILLTGPDGKAHKHEIKPVWMARYETRWDEYNVFWLGLDMSEKEWRAWWHSADSERASQRWRGLDERPEQPYMPPWGESLGIGGYPANCVHFQAAVKYCTWLSKHTGKKFRLPTEAEWEYACRTGGPALKPDAKELDKVAWFKGNAEHRPHPVGQKQPNAWGLYDMLGNVGEYVIGDPKDDKGLLAGGSYTDEAKDVHSAAREPYSPDWQKNDPQDPKSTNWFIYDVHHVGFRVVMEE